MIMVDAFATRGAPAPSRGPESDRPRLRVVGPPSRRRAPWSIRPTLVVVVVLVLGSLLFVAGAQAYLTGQSVRLGAAQARLAAASQEHSDLEWRVAQLSNPAHVVSTARRQGLTVPIQVTDLPQVTIPPVTATTHPTSLSASSAGVRSAATRSTASVRRGSRPRASGDGGG